MEKERSPVSQQFQENTQMSHHYQEGNQQSQEKFHLFQQFQNTQLDPLSQMETQIITKHSLALKKDVSELFKSYHGVPIYVRLYNHLLEIII